MRRRRRDIGALVFLLPTATSRADTSQNHVVHRISYDKKYVEPVHCTLPALAIFMLCDRHAFAPFLGSFFPLYAVFINCVKTQSAYMSFLDVAPVWYLYRTLLKSLPELRIFVESIVSVVLLIQLNLTLFLFVFAGSQNFSTQHFTSWWHLHSWFLLL